MKDPSEAAEPGPSVGRLEKALMRKRVIRFELWQSLILVLFCAAGVVLFSALALKGGATDATAIERFAHRIAEAPIIANRVIRDAATGYNPRLAYGQRFKGETGFRRLAGSGGGGALVLSRYDGDAKRGVVELLDLETGAVLHRWAPNIRAINARSRLDPAVVNLARDFNPRRYMEHHPLVWPDGSMIFHGMDSPLVKVDVCGRAVWTLDGDFHHSIERDADGFLWNVETIHPPSIPLTGEDFDDDAIAKISPDGEEVLRRSVAQILIDAGLDHIVYSHDVYDPDPIHLNDVQPVLADSPYWKRGDLFISLRNPSMVALYRPSTNEILWKRQGPWLKQHDVDIISDHEIAIFNNNAAATPSGDRTIGANDVVIYDFSTGKTRTPFSEAFEKHHVRTETNGLFRFFPDGSIMVEEHNYGRLLALTRDGDVAWRYVNRARRDGRVFELGWSRAISAEAAAEIARAAGEADCS